MTSESEDDVYSENACMVNKMILGHLFVPYITLFSCSLYWY